ncbi:MAG: GNAT family N-acetyltransferase [Sorangiineae bacterium]|nr:GNAT family N-acetyltransferase [Polyangiaceae bacterium]MEB2321030.1 GNAT family N-acetyltransferase [Sorangiineae bacterium]
MSWQERFGDRVATVAQAVSAIPRGRRILIGSGAAEPGELVDGLVRHGEHLADNEIVHLLTLGKAPYVEPGMERRFRHTALFIGANVRAAVAEGRADFMPVFLSEIPGLIRSRRLRVDVALIQVSEPDAHGYVSLGVSVDIVRAAVDSAELLIAEVNPRMPRTLGDSMLHVSELDYLVPVDTPLAELAVGELDDTCRQIGRNVASLVPDGATLQTGIGRIPHAVLEALGGHHDLGVHTEMLSDSVIDLVEGGVITGKQKTLLAGKLVTSFVMGTRRLYEWVHDNPAVEMRPSEFTNDPFVVARNDAMIAINSALAVDLTGQVAADTLMGRFFSGIGGQVDFIRGAARSRGGRPIIALPSTAKDGKLSRIRPAFEEGAGIVTSRGDVHYVVTEYGVADLWGKNIRQRVMALIDIAHPDHRAELLAAAKQRKYVFPEQVAPRAVYPWAEERRVELASGEQVLVRPARMSDTETLQDMFYRLSDESTYSRFMHYKKTHPHEEMMELVELDYERNMALVVTRADHPDEILAMSRYDVDPATDYADIAFVVRDELQGRGIGTLLMRRMAEIGRARGLFGFTADVLATNAAMLGVFHRSGLEVHTEHDGSGAYRVTLTFPPVRSSVAVAAARPA